MNKPFCVISCPIDTYSGYGSRSRDFVKAVYELKSEEWDIKVLPQRWGNTAWNFLEYEKENWGFLQNLLITNMDRQPDYWFQITVPNEFQPIGKLFSVGVTAGIETTMCHPTWLDGINRMPLTLVSSNHAKDVFANSKFEERDQNNQSVIKRKVTCEKPVEVLFEGVDTDKYKFIESKDLPKTELTEQLNGIEESFNYLFVGHWLPGDMGQDRKNITGTIQMFLDTFKDHKKKPGLILKTTKVTNSVIDRDEIIEAINSIRNTFNSKNLPNIYLIHGDLKDDEMNILYNHPKVKAMLYLGKGEGYGRPLLEFSLSKKPIIASGWSGHTDFLSNEFTVMVPGKLEPVHPSSLVNNIIIKESSWFTPDKNSCKALMEAVFERYDRYLEGAKRQAYKSKSEFSMEKMKEKLKEYLDSFPKPVALQLPKLKKIEVSN